MATEIILYVRMAVCWQEGQNEAVCIYEAIKRAIYLDFIATTLIKSAASSILSVTPSKYSAN
jgi:hypothetical protein